MEVAGDLERDPALHVRDVDGEGSDVTEELTRATVRLCNKQTGVIGGTPVRQGVIIVHEKSVAYWA